jgi:hypothetical protein
VDDDVDADPGEASAMPAEAVGKVDRHCGRSGVGS